VTLGIRFANGSSSHDNTIRLDPTAAEGLPNVDHLTL
jgi:hypothetical protein